MRSLAGVLTYFSMASARVPSLSFSMNAISKSDGRSTEQYRNGNRYTVIFTVAILGRLLGTHHVHSGLSDSHVSSRKLARESDGRLERATPCYHGPPGGR